MEFKSIKNKIIKEAMEYYKTINSTETPNSKEQKSDKKDLLKVPQKSYIGATTVSRLFKNLANIFKQNFENPDGNKPQIDRRQKREIEDKKNAQISQV